jgi:hypothetical protein
MHEYRELMAQQRAKRVWAAVFGAAIFLVLCVGAALVAYPLLQSTAEPTQAGTSPAVDEPATPVPALTLLPTHTSLPNTPIPTHTPSPMAAPTLAPSPEPSSTPPSDAQGDVGTYENGDPVEGVPGGVDIRAAGIGADRRVALQPTGGEPPELAGWATGDEVLLWVSLYDPVPDPPATFTDWVFVLDVDGDVTSGRPAGAVRINPDLGYEVAIGVSYSDASGEYEPYFLVWDAARSALVAGSDEPRFTLNESRALIGLALPLETLTQTVAQTSGVTLAPGEVNGRVAVVSRAGDQRVVDFYPDRPD